MSLRFGLIIAAVVLVSPPVVAQIQPDGTVGSQVRVEGDRWVIEGGAQRGSALFHSFEQFNVGRTPVYFRGLEAEQIFGRVTGGARSRINGTLGVEGLADLFLINPNGILFGPEAQLDINGSFVAATANGMVFDNYEFSANEPNEVPLLTIRGPVGLRYAQPTAPIQVVGSGHNLRTVDDLPFTPFIDPGATEAGFSVAPGESIALLGGQINVTGGVIAARSGNIVLGAIESGNLTLDDFRPVYAQNVERGNIQMDESALLNVSGLGGGSIHLWGNRVGIRNGSYVLNQNSGTSAAGFLEVDAAILTIEGLAPGRDELDVVRSGAGLRGFTSIGAGSHIQIEADRLNLINGGGIGTSTYGVGSGGDINLAVGSLSILGTLNILNGTPSYIQSLSLGSGDGGDILIVASDTVRLVDGGFLGSNVSFIADRPTSGDITITAGSLQVIGRNPNSRRRSIVFTGSNLETVSGDVSVRANSIEVRDGAFLGSYSFGLGTPGDVNLSADNILVSGFSEIPSPTFANDRQPNVRTLTRELESPARLDFSEFRSESHLDRTLVASLFISDFNEVEDLNVSNTSGNIQIDSRSLIVRDQAFITAVNGTSGEAGGIEIDTDTLILDEGGISADLIQLGRNTEANFGGNIEISSNDIYVDNLSLISSSASGMSNGGNLNIDTSQIVLIDSILRANGQIGFGGFVSLAGEVLYQDNSLILATSDISPEFDRVVEVEITELNERIRPELQETIPDISSIRESCDSLSRFGSSLVLDLRRLAPDISLSAVSLWTPSGSNSVTTQEPAVIKEASSFVVNDNGDVRLIAGALPLRLTGLGCF